MDCRQISVSIILMSNDLSCSREGEGSHSIGVGTLKSHLDNQVVHLKDNIAYRAKLSYTFKLIMLGYNKKEKEEEILKNRTKVS